jgi:hypothetical protein
MFNRSRKAFDRINMANGLALDYSVNQTGTHVLESIFVKREYADYFPFYESAVIVDVGNTAPFALLNAESRRSFKLTPAAVTLPATVNVPSVLNEETFAPEPSLLVTIVTPSRLPVSFRPVPVLLTSTLLPSKLPPWITL